MKKKIVLGLYIGEKGGGEPRRTGGQGLSERRDCTKVDTAF